MWSSEQGHDYGRPYISMHIYKYVLPSGYEMSFFHIQSMHTTCEYAW